MWTLLDEQSFKVVAGMAMPAIDVIDSDIGTHDDGIIMRTSWNHVDFAHALAANLNNEFAPDRDPRFRVLFWDGCPHWITEQDFDKFEGDDDEWIAFLVAKGGKEI